MNYIEPYWRLFQAQSPQRKASFIGGLTVIATLTLCLILWVISPHYGVLFSHLDTRDANQILTQLEQANITYKVTHQGSDILIDAALIDTTRIKLMSSDLPFTHSVGFELFDKTDFGMTDFSQKINYQRALQGELERTISSLDEIKQARVQLTIPEQHLFQTEHNAPRVAVTLHLNRPLTSLQIKSIQQLIAASVANLSLNNIIMVDQQGNGLTTTEEDATSGHFSEKKKIERYLNEKIMQLLRPIFNNTGIMVKIDATLNYDELQRERIKPEHDGLITHEKETQHNTHNKTDKTPTNQDVTREKSYEFGHEKEQFTRANGTVERLTISVVLPEKTTQEKITQVERLVKSVVGFNAIRGDSISVEALIAELPVTSTIEPITRPIPTVSNLYRRLAAGLVGIGALFYAGHKRLRIKQRQRLLLELNQWLTTHE